MRLTLHEYQVVEPCHTKRWLSRLEGREYRLRYNAHRRHLSLREGYSKDGSRQGVKCLGRDYRD